MAGHRLARSGVVAGLTDKPESEGDRADCHALRGTADLHGPQKLRTRR